MSEQKLDSPYLGKPLRISLQDDRIVYGIFYCIDCEQNIILQDTSIQMPDEYVAPVNKYLVTAFNQNNLLEKYIQFSSEILENQNEFKKLENEFFSNKYFTGQVMIPGSLIKKIEIQKNILV